MHSKSGKGKPKLAVIAAFILLLIVLYQISAPRQTDSTTEESPIQSAEAQWREVLEMGEHLIGEKISGTIKWQGSWESLLDSEEAANVLTTRLGLPAAEEGKLQDHIVYSSSDSRDALDIYLTITQTSPSSYYVVLRLEGNGAEALASMSQEHALLGQSILDEGVAGEWNGAVQGIRREQKEPEQGSLKDSFNELEKQFSERLDLSQVEQYEEPDTISRAYYSSRLPLSVNSGGQQVSLQVALHIHSVTGKQEVFIGAPLLTIEY